MRCTLNGLATRWLRCKTRCRRTPARRVRRSLLRHLKVGAFSVSLISLFLHLRLIITRLFKISRVGSGRVGSYQEVFKSHGSGLVGSISFQISRGGSGRVGPRSSRNSRAGSGHDPRDTDHVTDRATLTRELFGSDPRVGPTYLTRGSNTLKTYCFLPEGLSGADASFR